MHLFHSNKFRIYGVFITVAVCALIYLSTLIIYLSLHNFEISRLIHIGGNFAPAESLPENIVVEPNADGYDGQFFYRLAKDPFLIKSGTSPKLDLPAYRQQRILYPAIVWLLSLGNQHLVPYLMVFINLLAICLLTFFAARYLCYVGYSPFWAFFLCFYPGFLFCLLFDLPGPLEILFLLLVFFNLRLNRPKLSTAMLILAILVRETALLVAIVFILLWIFQNFWQKRRGIAISQPIKWYCGIIPAVFYMLWQFCLFIKWGKIPLIEGKGNIGMPFMGLIETVYRLLLPVHKTFYLFEVGLLLGLLILLFSCVISLFSKKVRLYERFSFIIYASILIFYTSFIWRYPGGYLRALSELYFFGFIILLSANMYLRLLAFGYWLLLYFASIAWLLNIRF